VGIGRDRRCLYRRGSQSCQTH